MAMSEGVKLALAGTLIAVLAVGLRIYFVNKERDEPAVMPKAATPAYKITDDDLVFLKQMHPSSFADLKDLDGKTLWVSAAGQMDYFPYSAGHVDYAHKTGTLLGAQEVVVKEIVKAVAPKTAAYRVPAGDRQYLVVFNFPPAATLGASANAGLPADQTAPGKLFAVPVGNTDKGQESFFTDQIFFYEDPHELYKHWGPEVWKAVDEHKATPGMSEKEVQTALGQVFHSGSNDYGNRTAVFDNVGHPVSVTFEHNKATHIQ